MQKVPSLQSQGKAGEKAGESSEVMAVGSLGKDGVFIICVLNGKRFEDLRSARSEREGSKSTPGMSV